MKKAPVGYFEGKPTRAVDFSEFAGAIVPEDTSDEIVELLKDRGIKKIEKSPAGNRYTTAERKKFPELMFSVGGIGALPFLMDENAGPYASGYAAPNSQGQE